MRSPLLKTRSERELLSPGVVESFQNGSSQAAGLLEAVKAQFGAYNVENVAGVPVTPVQGATAEVVSRGGGGCPAGADGAPASTLSHRTNLTADKSGGAGKKPGTYVEWATGGNMMRVFKVTGETRKGGGVRRPTSDYSRKSFMALLRSVNCIDRTAFEPPCFVTLTYPADYPSARGSKKHLDTMLKRLDRYAPSAAGWWKLEPQGRLAPHFHLLVFGVCPPCLWWAENWVEVVGESDPKERSKHLRFHLGEVRNRRGELNKPCVEQVRSWDAVNRYVSKYVGKTFQSVEWHEPGRFWGRFNRAGLNIEMVVRQIDPEMQPLILRVVTKMLKRKCGRWCLECDIWAKPKTVFRAVSEPVYPVHPNDRGRQMFHDEFGFDHPSMRTREDIKAIRRWCNKRARVGVAKSEGDVPDWYFLKFKYRTINRQRVRSAFIAPDVLLRILAWAEREHEDRKNARLSAFDFGSPGISCLAPVDAIEKWNAEPVLPAKRPTRQSIRASMAEKTGGFSF